jgi:ABC-type Fe3+ transport system substrate-binding protein
LKPIGLSAKAQHPKAGKLFIDVALSKEGQELIKSFNRIPERGDVTSDLKEGTKLYPADPRWRRHLCEARRRIPRNFFK